MKQNLKRHIKNIFDSLGIKSLFEVYNCNFDTLPEWTKNIELTNEFIVCCQDFSIKERLQGFIGKNIFKNGKYLYWFEGEKIIESDSLPINNHFKIEDEETKYLKTDTRLPGYIDDFIFNQLNAIYAPNFQRFEYNLDLSREEVKKYLGTYFPRSYAESFCIFDNMFQNEAYQKTIVVPKTLNILSVGCGTGGDIIGLITAIEKYFPIVSEIDILAIDGNNEALTILEQIIDRVQNQSSKKIKLQTKLTVFSSISEFLIENETNQNFEFILSFKFINEIISKGKGRLDHSYYNFAKKFLPLLSENGLCVLLDVTTKSKHTTYYPILMNRQVNQVLRELPQYSTLIPIPCSAYSNICNYDCFYQKTFLVRHSKHSNDKSRVAYRVLVSKQFKEKMNPKSNNSKQLIHNNNFCPFTKNGVLIEDAYRLNSNFRTKF